MLRDRSGGIRGRGLRKKGRGKFGLEFGVHVEVYRSVYRCVNTLLSIRMDFHRTTKNDGEKETQEGFFDCEAARPRGRGREEKRAASSLRMTIRRWVARNRRSARSGRRHASSAPTKTKDIAARPFQRAAGDNGARCLGWRERN